jgi:GAF domain-containing protein
MTELGSVDQLLELARRCLDMDVAFITEFGEGEVVFRSLAGDPTSFGWTLHEGPQLPDAYRQMMTSGAIPDAIPDASEHPDVRNLFLTASRDIGAYVGVAVRLADGSLYGSLCALSHQALPVGARDVTFLTMLAELVAGELEANRQQDVLRERLRVLIDAEQIETALQPIVDLESGRTVGVEALSRFPDGHGPPDEVFHAALAVGLGPEMERLALRRAFATVPMLGHDVFGSAQGLVDAYL